MEELLNLTRLIVVTATIVMAIKVTSSERFEFVSESITSGFKLVTKLGSFSFGVFAVFMIGMGVFVALGGTVILPDAVRFGSEPTPPHVLRGASGGRVNWAQVWPAVAQWRVEIEAASNECDVDPALIAAVMRQESVGDSDICSKAGACGLMQLMPATAREVRVTDRLDPAENTRGGACYLRQMLDRYGGNVEMALAAYNAGPGNVDKYGGVPPFSETQTYVKKVRGFYEEIAGSGGSGRSECCIWPVVGRITQGASAGHMALDIAATTGTPVVAAMSGKVIAAASGGNYGKRVMVDSGGGLITLYAHLSEITTREGDWVKQGQIVGKVGSTGLSTGPHLHFEIREAGQLLDPFPRLR